MVIACWIGMIPHRLDLPTKVLPLTLPLWLPPVSLAFLSFSLESKLIYLDNLSVAPCELNG